MVRRMKYKQSFVISVMAAALFSGILNAQDEKAKSVNNPPIVDEFSLVMRNLLKRAKAGEKGTPAVIPDHNLDSKVDEIQALLNKSDNEVSKASRLQSGTLIPQSESLEIQELEKLKAKIELDEERQLAALLITKAKIASIRKNIKNEKQRVALEKAGKGVDAALKIVGGEKK